MNRTTTYAGNSGGICFCTGECRQTGSCPNLGAPVWELSLGGPEAKPWKCPGCGNWKSPYVDECSCATDVRIDIRGRG